MYGLYFDVFGENKEGLGKALKAGQKLGISVEYRDVSKEFRQKIISSFYNEYVAGRTPNPCIVCNREIKFRVLEEEADRIGAYYISTGHYAGVCCGEAGSEGEKNCGDCFICRPKNVKKDQSYVLWRLDRETIKRLVFPLSDFSSKEEIRDILRAEGFDCAEDRDSQEICFIENNDYVSFLTEKMGLVPKEGDFVDGSGRTVGKHGGIIKYTVGQRKGLGVAFGKPTFVTAIDAVNNRVFLGSNEDLFKTRVVSVMNNFQINPEELFNGKILTAKVRYSAPPAECRIELSGDGLVTTVFTEAQRAVTPGQSVVWYDGDILAGGGIIVRGEK